MSTMLYILGFFLTIGLQGAWNLGIPVHPNLALVYYLMGTSIQSDRQAIASGLAAGAVVDSLSSGILGLHMIGYSAIGYLATSLRDRKLISQKYEFAIICIIASIVLNLIMLLSISAGLFASNIVRTQGFSSTALVQIMLDALIAGFLFLACYNPFIALSNSLQHRFGREQRQRSW